MDILQGLLQQLSYDPKAPMIFSSGIFLCLFVGFTFVYFLLSEKPTPRIIFVTLFSYYFYYKSSGIYFLLLALITTSDFYIAKAIARSHKENPDGGKRFRRWMLILSLLIDLGFLGYFKYANFFGQTFYDILGNNFQPWDIFLPVGISFFTFQSLSYTIDVYRGTLRPLDRLLDYAFYVSFFPQLVAGPIVRASDFVPQIRKPLVINKHMIAMGVYLIIIGLFKKAVISDYISINFVDRIFDNPMRYTGLENFFGLVGYAMQLYCDFSGYSDMAIGIALLLGFKFPKNFNAPFKADSVNDFWNRWHISLSTWIRDYIFIPLGGSRKGDFRTSINLIITMLLAGLWHGASWNFVIFGFLFGLAQASHRIFRRRIMHHDKHYHSKGIRRFFAVLLTFLWFLFTLLFFRNRELEPIGQIVTQITSSFHLEIIGQFLSGYTWVVVLIVIGYVTHFIPEKWEDHIIARLSKCNILVYALLLAALVFLICQVKSSEIQPFIYFQF